MLKIALALLCIIIASQLYAQYTTISVDVAMYISIVVIAMTSINICMYVCILQFVRAVQQQPQHNTVIASPSGHEPQSFYFCSLLCCVFTTIFAWPFMICTIPALIFSALVSNVKIITSCKLYSFVFRVKRIPKEESGLQQDCMVEWHAASTVLLQHLPF